MLVTALLGLVTAALFTGAAAYINIAEQPARLRLDDAALLAEWGPAYHRGTLMQAPLAVVSGALGAAAWWRAGDPQMLVAGLLLFANLPYTLGVILPTNRRLEALPTAEAAAARPLIKRWGWLHFGRTLLGAAGTLVYLAALT